MKLTAVNAPIVCRNMTRTELIRAAEHAFPYPSPIIQLMLDHLRGDVPVNPPDGSTHAKDGAVNCPACGAQLHIDSTGQAR